jgi:hypothetical protein
MPSDRTAPPEWAVEKAGNLYRDLRADWCDGGTKEEQIETMAQALAAVDWETREECAALCDEAADEADKYPVAIMRDGARALANAIRRSIR